MVCAGVAFHCDRRDLVRERDFRRNPEDAMTVLLSSTLMRTRECDRKRAGLCPPVASRRVTPHHYRVEGWSVADAEVVGMKLSTRGLDAGAKLLTSAD